MKNMMKEYLGSEYTNNHLRNFCLYWMKALEGSGDEWRKKNDLDCLYFNKDLRADTLISAWTPVKWVADCLNREYDIRFYKKTKNPADPYRDLKLLANDREAYLPPFHKLVRLLDEFLALAEQRCNYILLPDRDMNRDRYRCSTKDGEIRLFDEVPATLYHIFEKETLGKYFENKDEVVAWVKREHLEIGFDGNVIDQAYVLPLVPDLHPGEAKWLTEEEEIESALKYMISLLERRKTVMSNVPYIVYVENYYYEPNGNMGWNHSFNCAWGLMEDGTIIPIDSKKEADEIRRNIFQKDGFQWPAIKSAGSTTCTNTYIREDYLEQFQAYRKRGRSSLKIMRMMSEDKSVIMEQNVD